METIQISIFLGLICALFLCFIMIQVTYLFGGNQNISIEGYTYAEYARKGFFELIWVAIFSYLIMLISEKIVERKENKHSMAFKILSTTLILEVVIIMIAAFMRLSLYEDAYGFTQLRFYSHAFIVWLGIIFVLLAVKIHVHQKEGIHLFETFVSSLVFLGAINIMNPDGFIARQNINRMTNPNLVDLDTEYLRNLSEDAIPELIPLLDSDNEYVRKQTGNSLWEIREKKRQHPEEYNQWQSWNFSRNAADNSLNSLGAALETYKHEYYDEDYRYSDGKGG